MTNTNSLPRYRCHKEVQAAKITDVNISNRGEPVLTIEGGALQPVTKEYIEKHDPQTGGYFVLYEDGYQSYSPAVAFESGYTSIENLNVMERELKSASSEIIINSKPLKYSVSAPEGTESVTLHCQQMVKINGIPFFLMEDVQAYTGSKGNVALAFGEQPSVGVGDSEAGDTGYNINLIARISHEVNRAYCSALGDGSQMSWDDAPDWQKDSARRGVEFHLNGEHGPEASHNSWLAQKQAEGWTYGPVKDAEKKEHPCFVPYEQLPKEQQVKDYLFRAVVHAFK